MFCNIINNFTGFFFFLFNHRIFTKLSLARLKLSALKGWIHILSLYIFETTGQTSPPFTVMRYCIASSWQWSTSTLLLGLTHSLWRSYHHQNLVQTWFPTTSLTRPTAIPRFQLSHARQKFKTSVKLQKGWTCGGPLLAFSSLVPELSVEPYYAGPRGFSSVAGPPFVKGWTN